MNLSTNKTYVLATKQTSTSEYVGGKVCSDVERLRTIQTKLMRHNPSAPYASKIIPVTTTGAANIEADLNLAINQLNRRTN